MNENILFDEKTHTYRDKISGRTIPSVTRVMADVGLIDTSWFKEQDAIRGTYVHTACLYYDDNDLNFDTLDDIVKPYVEAYIKFKQDTGFIIDLKEEIVFGIGYCGRLDRTGILNGCNVLLDLKSGKAQKWTAIQTAAYAKPLQMPLKRFSLELRKDGKYNLSDEYKNRDDFNIFMGALAVYNWKN